MKWEGGQWRGEVHVCSCKSSSRRSLLSSWPPVAGDRGPTHDWGITSEIREPAQSPDPIEHDYYSYSNALLEMSTRTFLGPRVPLFMNFMPEIEELVKTREPCAFQKGATIPQKLK